MKTLNETQEAARKLKRYYGKLVEHVEISVDVHGANCDCTWWVWVFFTEKKDNKTCESFFGATLSEAIKKARAAKK